MLVVLLVAYPQDIRADTLKNKDFLQWKENAQLWFIDSAIVMAGHIALMNKEGQGRCIWEWYEKDARGNQARILEAIKKHPDHTPTGMIIAFAQKACGPLKWGR